MRSVISMEKRFYRLSWACALMVFYLPPVHADSFSDPIDFALHLSRLKTELSDGQETIDTTLKQAGITTFSLNKPSMQPGLSLGYAYIDTANQPLSAGMELEGFYIGVALRSILIDNRRATLSVTGSYLYQHADDSNSSQTVNLDWYQPQLDIDALWRLNASVGLTVGGRYSRVEADERIEGAVNQSLQLKRSSTLGGHAGVQFDLGEDGQMGALVHQGVSDGAEIYFQRQF
jgi:hypothetical protein